MGVDRLVLDSVITRAAGGGEGFDAFREGARSRLLLWGRLPAPWAGNLALHAYAAGFEVESGDAMRTRQGNWAATFLMRSSHPDASTFSGDLLNMARRAPRLVPPLPAIEVETGIEPSRSLPGSVYAHVSGKDSIGLLAEVLRRFGAYGMQPRQLTLRTEAGEVRDWFWLEPDPLWIGDGSPAIDAAGVDPLAALE